VSDQWKIGPGWLLLEKAGKMYLGRDASLVDEEPEESGEDVVPGGEEPEEGGEPEGLEFTLNPCYEVRRALMQGALGQPTNVAILAEPYFFFGFPVPVTVFAPDVMVDVSELEEPDLASIRELVKMAEASRMQTRAARAGITTPKLVPASR
jgi:hypothetical protein